MLSKTFKALLASLTIAGATGTAHAETDLEQALANGAIRLTSGQIMDRFIGKTATFVSHKTGDEYLLVLSLNRKKNNSLLMALNSVTRFRCIVCVRLFHYNYVD